MELTSLKRLMSITGREQKAPKFVFQFVRSPNLARGMSFAIHYRGRTKATMNYREVRPKQPMNEGKVIRFTVTSYKTKLSEQVLKYMRNACKLSFQSSRSSFYV